MIKSYQIKFLYLNDLFYERVKRVLSYLGTIEITLILLRAVIFVDFTEFGYIKSYFFISDTKKPCAIT